MYLCAVTVAQQGNSPLEWWLNGIEATDEETW